jgi:exonuclease III
MVAVATGGIRLLATYFPSTAPQIADAWLPLLGQHSAWVQDGRPTLLVGDLNSGRNPGDTQSSRLTGGANFALMLKSGWVDIWRELNPNASEFTWFSDTKHGHFGFRLDHALSLNWSSAEPISARYDHSVRENKLSDHSMLIVDW